MFEPFAQKVTVARRVMKTALATGHMTLMTPSPRPWRQASLYNWTMPRPSDSEIARLGDLPYRPPPRDNPRDQLDDPARDTRGQYYQDSVNFISPPFVVGNAYEVARFAATPDEAGIVKFIWTWAEVNDGSPNPVALDPGDPFALERYGIFLRWHLKLYQGTFAPIGPLYAGTAATIPGSGYPNLPNWTDQRFGWGRTAAIAFYLVPANFAIRLYCEVLGLPLIGYRLGRIGGRLQGYTQPIFMTSTGENVRHGW